MADRRTRSAHLLQQGVMILMGVLLLYMGVSVIRQVSLSQQRKEDRDQIERNLVLAQEKTAALEEELAYIQSPEAVEAYGRANNLARRRWSV